MSRRQKAINSAVTKRKETQQYLARKKYNIYPRRIVVKLQILYTKETQNKAVGRTCNTP